jgi:hypothetical protein
MVATSGAEVGRFHCAESLHRSCLQSKTLAYAEEKRIGAVLQEAREMALKARAASRALQALQSEDRVAILNRIAESLEQHEQQIMAENAIDVEAATGKISDSLLQRLVLKPNKIHQLAGDETCS